jgi:formate dehydrogenase iron-sulfur subunit
MKAAILTDMTKCVGCQACALACKEINHLPKDCSLSELSAKTWTAVQYINSVNIRRHCMHCEDPACVSACPVAALEKTKEGAVIYDASKCMGCRYCMIACPFDIPKYEWHSALPQVQKCIFCYENALKNNKQPACTEACPARATVFGSRNKLLQIARDRLQQSPKKYVQHIYGLDEAGGTSVFYLSSVPFEKLGFPKLRTDPYPHLTWKVLSKIPNVVSVGFATLLGIWWIVNRRIKLENQSDQNVLEEQD